LCADVGEREVGVGSGEIFESEITDEGPYSHDVVAVVEDFVALHLDWVIRVGVDVDVGRGMQSAGICAVARAWRVDADSLDCASTERCLAFVVRTSGADVCAQLRYGVPRMGWIAYWRHV
jgi:hypothetical protein